jgi:ion channel POLLUX/CASTOR
MGRGASLRARLRYRFDSTLSAGTAPLILYLALITFGLVLLAGLVLAVFDVATSEAGGRGFVEAVWQSLLRTLDPGTMAGDEGWPYRVVALLVTLTGIFVVSALIGLISAGIDRKLDELRKGRSPVLETGHTLVLGWSPKLFSIVSELVIANENQPDSCIVVLAPVDKVEMEDELRIRVPRRGRTRLVCRTGSPADPVDLELVRARDAKAVIVLSPSGTGGDAHVTRAVLALMHGDPRLELTPVFAEFVDARHAATLEAATGGNVVTIVSTEVIARITAQVCRQAGLSFVYQELLDFASDEIYFHLEPSLTGRTFAEAAVAFERAAVLGISRADDRVELNPPADAVLGDGDRVIAITEDDDTFELAGTQDADRPVVASSPPGVPVAVTEHVLILGWNELGPLLLRELDENLGPGSSVRVVADPRRLSTAEVRQATVANVELTVDEGDTTAAEPLARCLLHEVDHVVILCYREDLSPAESDARTLMTLLQLRQALGDLPPGRSQPSVVTELIDVRDVELAQVTSPDDFVVSERLTSLMMAQLSENPALAVVFDDLFDAGRTNLALKPASSYVALGESVSFGDVVRASLIHREVAIGYRAAGEVVLNPPKSAALSFGPDDSIVALTGT